MITRDLKAAGLRRDERKSLEKYVRDQTAPYLAGPNRLQRRQPESDGTQPGRRSGTGASDIARLIRRLMNRTGDTQPSGDAPISDVVAEAVNGKGTRRQTEREQVITVAAAHLVNDILNSNKALQKALADDRNESQALLRVGGLMPPLTSSRLNGSGVGAALDGPSPHEPLPYGELVERGVRSEPGVDAGAGVNTGPDMPQSGNGAFEIFRSDYSEQAPSVPRSAPDAPQSSVQGVGGPGPHVPPFHNDEAPPVPPKIPHGSSAAVHNSDPARRPPSTAEAASWRSSATVPEGNGPSAVSKAVQVRYSGPYKPQVVQVVKSKGSAPGR
ncbi:hypothetical protein [Streptomyces sp. 8N616]|uniref:hypothetical protein n=1 Tax=Streptomyces sp. 8N616 TaxID=3457414 RepID=UPI003FD5EAA5